MSYSAVDVYTNKHHFFLKQIKSEILVSIIDIFTLTDLCTNFISDK